MGPERAFTQQNILEFAGSLEALSGIHLGSEKQELIEARLAQRLRAVGLSSASGYLEYIRDKQNIEERKLFVSLLSTNVTRLGREAHHFRILREEIENKLSEKIENNVRVRVWSAGCSTGEEAYEIASHFWAFSTRPPETNLSVLATDIDVNAIAQARQKKFGQNDLDRLTHSECEDFFREREHGHFSPSEELKKTIHFRCLNLLSNWDIDARFDVIFCRNVSIYFAKDAQNFLWSKLVNQLNDDGLLIIGHSEQIANHNSLSLDKIGPGAYRFR